MIVYLILARGPAASVKGSTKEVRAALEAGAEIDSVADSQGGRTALMVRVIRITLPAPGSHMVSLSLNSLCPSPPPKAACLAGKHKVVKQLLRAGANWKIGEKDGYTCLHGAAFQGP